MQKIGIVIALAAALFVVPALGLMDENLQNAGVFQSDAGTLRFPVANVNFDSIISGHDNALAFGPVWGFRSSVPPVATNSVGIKKAQNTGKSGFSGFDGNGYASTNNTTINIEYIKLGDRRALAFGSAVATNNIQITATQNGND